MASVFQTYISLTAKTVDSLRWLTWPIRAASRRVRHWLRQGEHAETIGSVNCSDVWNVSAVPIDEEFERKDGEANLLATKYRSNGLIITALGMVLLMAELGPSLWPRIEHHFWSWIRLGLLSLALVVWLVSRQRTLKDRWKQARLSAEALRYRRLRATIQAATFERRSSKSDSPIAESDIGPSVRRLLEECRFYMRDQIEYNRKKYLTYEKVRELGEWLAWIAAFAVAARVGWEAWYGEEGGRVLPLLVIGPIVAGGLNGANAFLGISRLIEEHQRMIRRLQSVCSRFNVMGPDLLQDAELLLRILDEGNEQWQDQLEQSPDVKPGGGA